MFSSIRSLFSRRSNISLFLGGTFGIFCLFILIPVWTTPGNDVLFQLSLFKPSAYILMGLLSVGNAYLLTLQREIRKRSTAVAKAEQLLPTHAATQRVRMISSGIGIITSSVLATVSCAACYSSLLALFGLGGSIFIVEHRWWFAAAALGLTLLGIYHSTRRLVGVCTRCAA